VTDKFRTYEEMVVGLQGQLKGLDAEGDHVMPIAMLIVGLQGACWCAERIARAVENSR
jgi:hypothetical protein